MPFTKSGPNPHANTASDDGEQREAAPRCCMVMPRDATGRRTSDGPSDSRLRSRHDRDPRRARASTACSSPSSRRAGRSWPTGSSRPDLPTSRGSRATADEHGFFYVAVCDHIAIPESLGVARWAPTGRTASPRCRGSAAHDRAHQPAVARVRAPLPPPARRGQGVRDPRLPLGRPGHRRDRRRPRARPSSPPSVSTHTRRGKLVEEKLPLLIEALEHEFVDGLGAQPRPVQSPRPPVWIAGSSPAAIRRAATFGDGWLPQGPSNAEMVEKLQAQREEHGRADRPMMIGDITPFLYVGNAGVGRRRGRALAARPATSPSRSWPTPPTA